MNERSNKYAIAALKSRRAEVAGEAVRLKGLVANRLKLLAHIDATIKLLDPDFKVETIRPKRPRQVRLFGNGELGRLILDALRRANGQPQSAPQIAKALIDAKGYDDDALPALALRVRANLGYLLRHRGAVAKTGNRLAARWHLPRS